MDFVGLREFAQNRRSVKARTLLLLAGHMTAFKAIRPFLKAWWKRGRIIICPLVVKLWWLWLLRFLLNSWNLNVLNIILNLLKTFVLDIQVYMSTLTLTMTSHRLYSKVKFFRYFKDRQCHKSCRKSLQEI